MGKGLLLKSFRLVLRSGRRLPSAKSSLLLGSRLHELNFKSGSQPSWVSVVDTNVKPNFVSQQSLAGTSHFKWVSCPTN